jgi:diadenosine tetraphosphate (Ap4A) HIT family hydrolase
MDTQPRRCEFCDEFSGGTRNAFVDRYQDDAGDRTIFETKGFKVVPSLGQFVQGYLLMIPKEHRCALADLPAESLRELEQLKTALIGALRSKYGGYVLFEHGARTENSGGCGISHAHLHAVPLPVEQDPLEALRASFRHQEISRISEIRNIPPECSYLYYEDVRGGCHVFYPAFLPSQFMRRLIAERLGLERWDWRSSGREDSVLATRSDVSMILRDVPVVSTCEK